MAGKKCNSRLSAELDDQRPRCCERFLERVGGHKLCSAIGALKEQSIALFFAARRRGDVSPRHLIRGRAIRHMPAAVTTEVHRRVYL
jgi:hypothetical protein